ncbi:MAG: hypothetical protein KME54_04255 [Tolypothrix brevis GSE-NOS-MK-07-07A]|nr:hypothetical protein [Tolypothrix brevis GSE-NOS-MK-07-07A]
MAILRRSDLLSETLRERPSRFGFVKLCDRIWFESANYSLLWECDRGWVEECDRIVGEVVGSAIASS